MHKMLEGNSRYIELLADFPPFPIKNEEDLERTQAVVDRLIDQGELSDEEEEYLDLLGILIYEYESKQDLIPDIYGVELLEVLIVEMNLKQKDLVPIFKTESIVSDVLNRKRRLTVDHIQKLAEFFKVSPAVFFPESRLAKDFLEVA